MHSTSDFMNLTEDDKKFLLDLARTSIRYYLTKDRRLELDPADVPSKELVEDGACFVTLHKGDELRGCIGTLEAHRPLFTDVIENAVSSAVGDPRFPQLILPELELVTISISVLTKPKPLSVSSPEDLMKKIVPKKHGLILKRGVASATFLPVVWEQLPEKEEFLAHLSVKAGLAPDGWKDPETEFLVYEAIEFSE